MLRAVWTKLRAAADLVCWLATSDPAGDVPWRELAPEEAGFYETDDEIARSEAAFAALDLLADRGWHAAHAD